LQWPPRLPRGFPLTVVERGYMARIAGKPRWICGKRPPDEALAIYHRKASALTSKAEPIRQAHAKLPAAPTLHYLLNRWVIDRRSDAMRGELRPGTFQQYRLSAKRIDRLAGQVLADDVTPDTVKDLYDRLAAAHGIDFAKRAIAHFRSACNYAVEMRWCRPLRIGGRAIAKLATRPRARMKWKLYEPADLRRILAEITRRIRSARGGAYRDSWVQLKAMVLLALNGGFGATELSELRKADVRGDWIDRDRGKTGATHVVPLWPETAKAICPVLEQRPDDELLFRTRAGKPWARSESIIVGGVLKRVVNHDNVNWAFRVVVNSIGLRIEGQGFYKLRHLFATTADRFQDANALSVLMGHALPGARGHYIAVGDERLRKLVEYVRHELLLNRPARSQSRAQPQTRRQQSPSARDTRSRRARGSGGARSA
jgi:hypothetical protein